MRDIQSEFHHISTDAIEYIATSLQIPRTQIISVIEFYSFLHTTPQSKYTLLISNSITGYRLGSHDLIAYLASQLKVAIGELCNDLINQHTSKNPVYHAISGEYE